jgi:L(+)-tartrate dehydratase beta subunit
MEHRLRAPLSDGDVRRLRVGDAVLLDGTVWGLRDATLIRIFDQGQVPPVDLRGGVLLHVAPSVRPSAAAPSGYEPMTVGTTTSTRMERFTRGLLRDYGVRAIIGKGGLLDDSSAAFAEYGGAYLAIVGGAASVETEQVEAIERVYWEDLMPQCLWQFRVRAFGPLTVAMDSQGASLYRDVARTARERLAAIYAKMGLRP